VRHSSELIEFLGCHEDSFLVDSQFRVRFLPFACHAKEKKTNEQTTTTATR